MKDKIFEFLWDCASCDRTRILGRHTRCPSCGASVRVNNRQDPYYDPGPGAPEVTDPELLRMAMAGVNKVCTRCDAIFRAGDTECPSCGTVPAEGVDIRLGGTPPRPPRPSQSYQPWTPDPPSTPRTPVPPAAVAGVLAALALLALLCWGFSSHGVTAEVTAKTWSRTVAVETWVQVTRSDWSHNITTTSHVDPVEGHGERAGKENVRNCRQDISGYHKVRTGSHQVCASFLPLIPNAEAGSHGNGFGSHSSPSHSSPSHSSPSSHASSPHTHVPTCHTVTDYTSVPDYDTKCDYDTWVWAPTTTKTAEGTATDPRVWPELDAAGALQRTVKSENAAVTLTYRTTETYEYPIAAAVYDQWPIGKQVPIRVSNFGSVSEVLAAP